MGLTIKAITEERKIGKTIKIVLYSATSHVKVKLYAMKA
jgi:hypothetical protein